MEKRIRIDLRRVALSELAIAVILFFIVYADTLAFIIKGWFTFEGAHGILILCISIYMTWVNRRRLAETAITPMIIPGGTLVIIGGLALIAGEWSVTPLIKEIAFVVTMLGLVLLLFGRSYFKILWVPVGYLFFMFPVFEKALDPLSLYFQRSAVWVSSFFLNIMSVPFIISDTMIYLPNITLEVVRACNGITHIMGLSVLAGFWAYINRWTKTAAISLITLAFIIGVLLNGMRIGMIGIWTFYSEGKFSHGPFDIFYTSFIFIGGFSLLALGNLIYNWGKKGKNRDGIRIGLPSLSERLKRNTIPHKPILVAMIIIGFVAIALNFGKPVPQGPSQHLGDFPLVVGDWVGTEVNALEEPYEGGRADIGLKRIYRSKGGKEVKFYLGYFSIQREGRQLIDPIHYDWLHYNAELFSFKTMEGRELVMKKTDFKGDKGGKRAYFYYLIDGKVVHGRYRAKIALAMEGFLRNRTNGAIIIVSTENARWLKKGEEDDLIRFIENTAFMAREFL